MKCKNIQSTHKQNVFACAVFISIFLINFAATLAEAADKKASEAAVAAPAAEAPADVFSCEANVTFTWQPKPPSAPVDPRQPPPAPPKEETEFADQIRTQGSSEENAKAELTRISEQAKASAMNTCNGKHQSKALCVQRQLRTAGRDYAMLDYTPRKAMLDSINADCQAAVGKCLSATIGEATCKKEEAPKAAAAPEAAKDAAAGADKKKK